MARRTCPVCGNRGLTPIAYGFPGPGMMEASERGEVALGGCVISDDDPDRYCPSCRVRIFGDGTYQRPDDEADREHRFTVLERATTGVVEAAVDPEGGLTIVRRNPDGSTETLMSVSAEEAPTALLMVLVQRFGDGTDIPGWLDDRGIPFWTAGTGPLVGVSIDAELALHQADGETLVPLGGPVGRVLLGCVRDLLSDSTFTGIGDLAHWFGDHGLGVLGTAV